MYALVYTSASINASLYGLFIEVKATFNKFLFNKKIWYKNLTLGV